MKRGIGVALAFVGLISVAVFWTAVEFDSSAGSDGDSPNSRKTMAGDLRRGKIRGETTKQFSATKTRNFGEEYDSLSLYFDGEDLTNARYELIQDASETLNLDDFLVFTESLFLKPGHDYATATLATRFVEEDLDGGLLWLSREESCSPSSQAPVIFGKATLNSLQLKEVIKQIGGLPMKAKYLKGALFSSDIEIVLSATALLSTHPEISNTDGTILQMAADSVISEGRIGDALRILNELPDGSARSSMAKRIFSTDSVTRKKLIETLPTLDQADRNAGIHSIVSRWVTIEPDAASDWIASLPTVEGRDAGKIAVSQTLLDTHLRESYEWAQTVTDEVKKKQLVKNVVTRARVMKPELLAEWGLKD